MDDKVGLDRRKPDALNRGRVDYLSQDDSENEELCDLETPKIGKVLDSINEMMNSMERE
jgi:hypothetical protein